MRISDWSSDVCSSDLKVGGTVSLLRLAVVNGFVYFITLMIIGATFWRSLLIAALVAAFSAVGNVPRFIALGGFVLIFIVIGISLGLLPHVKEIYELTIRGSAV